MTNLETAKKYQDYMVKTRRYLHEHPELTGCEYETVKFIDEELTRLGIEHTVVENGGVLGFIRGPKKGRTVLLRADVDALPVLEKDNLKNCRPVWSKNPGVMHACGHDGHTAGLLGAARVLLEKRDELEGDVILCFERGEEGGGNVRYIFAYMDKNDIHVDSCFGLHVGHLPTGKVAVNDTRVNAGSMRFQVTIEGRGGHGSRPDKSINPIDCFVAVYQRLQALRLTAVDPYQTCTYSVGSLSSGAVPNVIPQTLTFSGTMRTYDPETAGMTFHNEMKKIIETTCESFGCTAHFDKWSKSGLATINDPAYAAFARKVLGAEIGEDNACQQEPSMGSESYAMYLKMWPGVFGGLGASNPEKGTGAANHNERFDIDEDCLAYGACAHATYAIEYLKLREVPESGPKMSFKEILKLQGREDMIEELYK
ncbi:MAG: amidohydrolase [Firmicutes bacterium]|nr:amidohydrolase [Bacillota bacterium]